MIYKPANYNANPTLADSPGPKRLNKLTSSSILLGTGNLGALYDQIQLRKELQQILQKHLPEALKYCLEVKRYKNQELVVTTQSQSQANRIRCMLPAIQQRLQQHPVFSQLTHIKLTISFASSDKY